MINTSVNKNEHTIQSGVVDYPIGFPFYFNPDRTPQLLVKIGDEELRFNHNFELSEDKGSVVLRPTEEESWTLEGPEDFSWMTKWDGKDLLIERVVPFVQDSDYQLGRISSEQIERDFDLSVMRDQTLLGKIAEHTTDVSEELESLHTDISDINAELATKATKAELNSYKQTTNATIIAYTNEIIANTNRIESVRLESRAADSEIRQILNMHQSELTTLRGNQASMGDQVSDIEEKIPESASSSNPLITQQQLLDEEKDIRNDLNSGLSEVQTQITAQAAKIETKQDKLKAGENITIVDNVISSTGGGDFLPLSGGTITGKVAIDVGESPTTVGARKALGFTGTVDGYKKEHWFSYVPQSDYLDVGNLDFTNIGNITPHGNGEKNIGSSTRKFNIVHTNSLSSAIGKQVLIPAKSGTVALTEDVADAVANIDALPDQTGNAGKVLTTDGAKASWQEPQGGGSTGPEYKNIKIDFSLESYDWSGNQTKVYKVGFPDSLKHLPAGIYSCELILLTPNGTDVSMLPNGDATKGWCAYKVSFIKRYSDDESIIMWGSKIDTLVSVSPTDVHRPFSLYDSSGKKYFVADEYGTVFGDVSYYQQELETNGWIVEPEKYFGLFDMTQWVDWETNNSSFRARVSKLRNESTGETFDYPDISVAEGSEVSSITYSEVISPYGFDKLMLISDVLAGIPSQSSNYYQYVEYTGAPVKSISLLLPFSFCLGDQVVEDDVFPQAPWSYRVSIMTESLDSTMTFEVSGGFKTATVNIFEKSGKFAKVDYFSIDNLGSTLSICCSDESVFLEEGIHVKCVLQASAPRTSLEVYMADTAWKDDYRIKTITVGEAESLIGDISTALTAILGE